MGEILIKTLLDGLDGSWFRGTSIESQITC